MIGGICLNFLDFVMMVSLMMMMMIIISNYVMLDFLMKELDDNFGQVIVMLIMCVVFGSIYLVS